MHQKLWPALQCDKGAEGATDEEGSSMVESWEGAEYRCECDGGL